MMSNNDLMIAYNDVFHYSVSFCDMSCYFYPAFYHCNPVAHCDDDDIYNYPFIVSCSHKRFTTGYTNSSRYKNTQKNVYTNIQWNTVIKH